MLDEKIIEIKAFLKSNNITYEELAKQSDIPIGTLKSIFSGRTPNPRMDTMQAIEKALGFTSPTSVTQYTEKENDLVRLYRALPNEQLKARVFAYVIGLLEGAGVDTKQLI